MPELQTILTYRVWRASDGEGQVFPPPYDEGGTFCRRGPGWRAALLHRDQEVSPTGEIVLAFRRESCVKAFNLHK